MLNSRLAIVVLPLFFGASICCIGQERPARQKLSWGTPPNAAEREFEYEQRSCVQLTSFLPQQLQEAVAKEPEPSTVRLLTIGNSFAGNACKYLTDIAASGDVQMAIGIANLGGCTLERHATLAEQSASDPSVRPYRYATDGKSRKLSLQDYLVAQPWDYVTVQQMSALSFRPETYEPHIGRLVALVHELAPQAKLLIHQTWAYRQDAPLLEQWGISQQEMHEQIVGAYGEVAERYSASIIPVGSAFALVRSLKGREVVAPDPSFDYTGATFPNLPNQDHSLVVGWHWNRTGNAPRLRLDFKHGNAEGCYLAGLVWYEVLTGRDARQVDFRPATVAPDVAEILRTAAHNTVDSYRPPAHSRTQAKDAAER